MESESNSHKKLIRERLLAGGTISPLEALREYGCYRLASRISDLKREGMNIDKTMEESISSVTGKIIRFARYSLKKQSNAQSIKRAYKS